MPKTSKVLLIGDSIRLNSEPFVRPALNSTIELFSPNENCESSAKVLNNLKRWMDGLEFDAIHLNCGLHDVRYNPNQNNPVSTLEQYSLNLERIFGFLANLPLKVVWATSTPIDEAIHNQVKVSRRYLQDVIDYNHTSVELARRFGFEVNDLFSKVSTQNLSSLLLPDGIHFNETGNKLLGELISQVVNYADLSSNR